MSVRITPEGGSVNPVGLSRTRWSALSRYVETRRLFVLFSADNEAAHLTRAGNPRR